VERIAEEANGACFRTPRMGWSCRAIWLAASPNCAVVWMPSSAARSISSSAPSWSPRGTTFPHLSLVGVVDADLGLATADPRAAERTFQLLQQVTGRAGRMRLAGAG
jgi:hypothetical protein